MSGETETAAAYALDAVLDYRAAAPLRDALLERRGGPLQVDASRVEKMGALCLQVLVAARRAWNGDHVPFGFGVRSAAFDSSVTAFGASEALGISRATE